MKTSIEILEMAFQSLQQTSREDVKLRTKQLGIEIPQEPKLSCLVNHFIFDLSGVFNEIINSKKTEWVDFESLKRKNITVNTTSKSHEKVALCFLMSKL